MLIPLLTLILDFLKSAHREADLFEIALYGTMRSPTGVEGTLNSLLSLKTMIYSYI